MKVLQLPSHFTPTHETAGLPGFPAVDVFAPSWTPVAAPVDGHVVKLSGRRLPGGPWNPWNRAGATYPGETRHPPGGPLGWTLYIADDDGVYFVTHLGQVARRLWRVGAPVRRGSYLGKVAPYLELTGGVTPSHVHEGFHAGAWQP